MPEADQVIARFLGGGTIAGSKALHELVALGDSGEEALFSQPIEFPKSVQVKRRWLRYVASRQESIAGRLIDRNPAATKAQCEKSLQRFGKVTENSLAR